MLICNPRRKQVFDTGRQRDFLLGAFPGLHAVLRVALQAQARSCQLDTAAFTRKQYAIEALFQPLDARANRGLSDVQALGGVLKAASRGDFEEGAHRFNVHGPVPVRV